MSRLHERLARIERLLNQRNSYSPQQIVEASSREGERVADKMLLGPDYICPDPAQQELDQRICSSLGDGDDAEAVRVTAKLYEFVERSSG